MSGQNLLPHPPPELSGGGGGRIRCKVKGREESIGLELWKADGDGHGQPVFSFPALWSERELCKIRQEKKRRESRWWKPLTIWIQFTCLKYKHQQSPSSDRRPPAMCVLCRSSGCSPSVKTLISIFPWAASLFGAICGNYTGFLKLCSVFSG